MTSSKFLASKELSTNCSNLTLHILSHSAYRVKHVILKEWREKFNSNNNNIYIALLFEVTQSAA